VFVFEGSIMPMSGSGATLWLLDETISGRPAYPLPGTQGAYAMSHSLVG
jgi:hypothetical protein